ncbi:unnamed protein product [Sympodiomycopsis kandeliae]
MATTKARIKKHASSPSNTILSPTSSSSPSSPIVLPNRSSCEKCRNRKLKCDGNPIELGGCERCRKDGVECKYVIRAPIGRPKGATKRIRIGTREDEMNGVKRRKTTISTSPQQQQYGSQPVDSRSRTTSTSSVYSPLYSMASPSVTGINATQTPTSMSNGNVNGLPQSIYPTSQSNPSSTPLSASSTLDQLFAPAHRTASFQSPSADQSLSSLNLPSLAQSYPTSSFNAPPESFSQDSLGGKSSLTLSPGTIGFDTSNRVGTNSLLQGGALATLEMAAFLDSLDRVEIRSSDGLTGDLLPEYANAESFNAPSAASASIDTSVNEFPRPVSSGHDPVTTSPWAASTTDTTRSTAASTTQAYNWGGTILDEGVSYAVPSDFSWWNFGLDGDLMTADQDHKTPKQPHHVAKLSDDRGKGNTSASRAEIWTQQQPQPQQQQKQEQQQQQNQFLPTSIGARTDALIIPFDNPTTPGSPNRGWPRGPENGMGEGQITTNEGLVVKGGPWLNRGGSDFVAGEVIQSNGLVAAASGTGCEEGPPAPCCASKKHADNGSPAQDVRTNDVKVEPTIKTQEPCPRTGASSCCCSKPAMDATQDTNSDSDSKPSVKAAEETKSCCSNKKKAVPQEKPDDHGSTFDAPVSHSSPRVHCVPNPSGSGCTCLCESDVCLLRVRRTLSATPDRVTESKDSNTAPSLYLTLSASQAISASCACSSTCPTCRFHPSSSAFNASLLISLTLQIYARAVRILRDGFSEDGNGLEIKIGGYRPRKENAKKIALLAMKLELTDLERGMGKVWSVAAGEGIEIGTGNSASVPNTVAEQEANEKLENAVASDHDSLAGAINSTTTTKMSKSSERDRRLAPIDRIVIRKLREQLKEMITRVEALENET